MKITNSDKYVVLVSDTKILVFDTNSGEVLHEIVQYNCCYAHIYEDLLYLFSREEALIHHYCLKTGEKLISYNCPTLIKAQGFQDVLYLLDYQGYIYKHPVGGYLLDHHKASNFAIAKDGSLYTLGKDSGYFNVNLTHSGLINLNTELVITDGKGYAVLNEGKRLLKKLTYSYQLKPNDKILTVCRGIIYLTNENNLYSLDYFLNLQLVSEEDSPVICLSEKDIYLTEDGVLQLKERKIGVENVLYF